MKTKRYSVLVVLALIAVSVAPVASQELDENMAIFGSFVGHSFVGHYSNPEDSHYVHVLKIEPTLDGHAVRISKNVEELSFEMETLFYWDAEKQQVAYLSTTNKGQTSRGLVRSENNQLILDGENILQGGNREYRQSYEVLSTGTLEDRFYLKSGDEWQQRHLIVMRADTDNE
jgi:hypothetical protein